MPDRKTGPDLAKALTARLDSMRSERAEWESTWDEIATYVMPRKYAQIFSPRNTPNTAANELLFDSTAVYANQVLANGMLSYMTPADVRWFSFDPPQSKADNDKAKDWFQRCTEIAAIELANSNFYSEIHELYFNDGSFGTTAIVAMPGKRTTLNFHNLELGSFWIAEDDEGYIDTLAREYYWTSRQCAQKFGKENISPKMQKALDEFRKSGKEGNKFRVCQLIYPREEREYGKADKQNKPYASEYWCPEEKHILEQSGFDEQPFFATRHLKDGKGPYGIAPGWICLPDARQLNFIAKCMDALGEVTAFPRFLAPDDMVDEIDLRASGMTIFSDPNKIPREWMTGGRYDVGLDREKRKADMIREAFHVDLFQMFAQLDKQMTAREVAERSAEKLVQFTPAFARKTTELLSPILRRVFGILVRKGKFPAPPPDVIDTDGKEAVLPLPEISYNSRIALAVKGLQNTAYYRTLERVMTMAEMNPAVLDNYDFDKAERDSARNDGFPADWIRDEDEVKEIREARAEEQAKAAQMQEAMAMAQAGRDAAAIKPDSVVGQALQNQ